jgi:hypothetical protein
VDTAAFSIFLGSPEVLVTDEELAKLKDLQARMISVHDQVTEFGPGKVGPYIFRKRDEIHAAVAAGNNPGDVTVPERSQVEHTFRIRRSALVEQLKTLTHTELVPLARPILERFRAAISETMAGIEADERPNAVAWDIQYEPSPIWKTLAAVAVRYTSRRLPESHAWALPSHLLEGLVQL